jgi:hypothetical protein
MSSSIRPLEKANIKKKRLLRHANNIFLEGQRKRRTQQELHVVGCPHNTPGRSDRHASDVSLGMSIIHVSMVMICSPSTIPLNMVFV